jgi:pimeloyl-ACP methyl ester carboxylesterase
MVALAGAEYGITAWTEFDGDRMHYTKAGSGPPLLLLHGLLGGSFCWRYTVAELARFHTTYAIDLHGLGLSDARAEADCSMQAQANRVRAFIESIGLAELDVVGSSWGGAVALLLAARRTAVRSLVLAAPVNPWSEFGLGRVRFCASPFGGLLVRCALPFSRRFHHIGLERMYADPQRIRPGTLEGYSALLARAAAGHEVWLGSCVHGKATSKQCAKRCPVYKFRHFSSGDQATARWIPARLSVCKNTWQTADWRCCHEWAIFLSKSPRKCSTVWYWILLSAAAEPVPNWLHSFSA